MGQKKEFSSKYKEIISWKYGECPSCEFYNSCNVYVHNISICMEEEKEWLEKMPSKFLIKRALRFKASERHRNNLYSINNSHKRTLIGSKEPPKRIAYLYCSDITEYSQCKPTN